MTATTELSSPKLGRYKARTCVDCYSRVSPTLPLAPSVPSTKSYVIFLPITLLGIIQAEGGDHRLKGIFPHGSRSLLILPTYDSPLPGKEAYNRPVVEIAVRRYDIFTQRKFVAEKEFTDMVLFIDSDCGTGRPPNSISSRLVLKSERMKTDFRAEEYTLVFYDSSCQIDLLPSYMLPSQTNRPAENPFETRPSASPIVNLRSQAWVLLRDSSYFLSHTSRQLYQFQAAWSPQGCHRLPDVFFYHVLDILLGWLLLALIWLIPTELFMNEIYVQRMRWSTYLIELIHRLSGAPIGLKLNSELAATLGVFYMYYIYIWVAYLDMLQPFLYILVKMILVIPIAGITVLIALIMDMIQLMTFHILCLYVNASKGFRVIFVALTSSLRLFRGRKWNPLRKRVDTLPEDRERLVLGSILLTVSLYLLPTVLVFYVVFATLFVLRLGALALLERSIVLLSTLPLFSLLRRAAQPSAFPDRTVLDTVPSSPHIQSVGGIGVPCVSVHFVHRKPLSWLAVYQRHRLPSTFVHHQLGPSELLHRLSTGKLVS